MAGDTGARSRGRRCVNGATRCPSVFALLAVTRASASRRDARIGMSDRLDATRDGSIRVPEGDLVGGGGDGLGTLRRRRG